MRLALCTAAVASALTAFAIHVQPGNPFAQTRQKVTPVRQAKVDGRGVRFWAQRARENKRDYRYQRKRADRLARRLQAHLALPLTVEQAIRQVFGSYADQALAVARCESGLSVWATNGMYLGLFQMGSYARSRYGHASDALGQARAAYRYFVASGRDWSPWSCRPW